MAEPSHPMAKLMDDESSDDDFGMHDHSSPYGRDAHALAYSHNLRPHASNRVAIDPIHENFRSSTQQNLTLNEAGDR